MLIPQDLTCMRAPHIFVVLIKLELGVSFQTHVTVLFLVHTIRQECDQEHDVVLKQLSLLVAWKYQQPIGGIYGIILKYFICWSNFLLSLNCKKIITTRCICVYWLCFNLPARTLVSLLEIKLLLPVWEQCIRRVVQQPLSHKHQFCWGPWCT